MRVGEMRASQRDDVGAARQQDRIDLIGVGYVADRDDRLLEDRLVGDDTLEDCLVALDLDFHLVRSELVGIEILFQLFGLRRLVIAEAEPMTPITRSIERMGKLVSSRLRDVLDAYKGGKLDLAQSVWATDTEVDEHYNALFRELLTYMMGDPRTISACTHLLFMAKNLERIGDHATNVAEHIHYELTGEDYVEDRPKGDTLSPT